jgi:hypothetical protein
VSDFYEGSTAETKARYKKMQAYIELAQAQGDAILMDSKPWEMRIIIRLPKKEEK